MRCPDLALRSVARASGRFAPSPSASASAVLHARKHLKPRLFGHGGWLLHVHQQVGPETILLFLACITQRVGHHAATVLVIVAG